MVVREEFSKMRAFLGVTSVQTAADDDLIVTTVDMKVGAYTVAAQPTSPSKIGVKVTTVGNADTMGTIKFVGTDINNAAIEETIIPISGSTVWTTRYFKTVTSATGAGWVVSADTSKDTIIIGIPATGGIEGRGQGVTFICLSGIIYINPLGTAATTSIKLVAGQAQDLLVPDVLSYISDGNAATFQCEIWEA
jgi:hypothetical protein